MKHRFAVTARYPQAEVKHAHQDTIVTASNAGQAACRAFNEFRRREGIKGKRLTVFEFKVVKSDLTTAPEAS